MAIRKRSRRTNIITAYVMAVVILFFARQLASHNFAPASEPAENALIFISDTDPIDVGRGSNSVYRVELDGSGMKRIVGTIPHGAGYLRASDIDCEHASQQLVIASYRRDLNGFHHALLDGSGLHFDKPAAGDLLSATRQIAIAPDGMGILVSRQDPVFDEPRFSLVAGDLMRRQFMRIKLASTKRSYLSPDWSPDGQHISYIVERTADGNATYMLAVAKPDGSDERLIYASGAPMSDLSWSPAGGWLALEIGGQIYKLRPDGSELTRLSAHPAGARSPRWSPDGMRISFVAPSSFPGFNQLLTMNVEGGDIRQVANIHGSLVNGCWV